MASSKKPGKFPGKSKGQSEKTAKNNRGHQNTSGIARPPKTSKTILSDSVQRTRGKVKRTPDDIPVHQPGFPIVGIGASAGELHKMTPEEVQKLVHELQVHQIELQMQKEELRQTQIDLQVVQDRYATLFDFSPVGFVTLDGKGQILEANLTFCHLVGIERLNILKKKFEKYVDPGDQGAFRLYLESLKQKAGTHSSDIVTLKHPTSSRRVRLEGCVDDLDSPAMPNLFRIAVEDVTMWEILENEQKEQQALLGLVVGGVMDAIITIDEHERIVLFNKAAEIMFGCSASIVLGQSLNRFIPERYRTVHHRHVRHFGENPEFSRQMGAKQEICGLRANGAEFPIEATISQVELKGKGEGNKLFMVVLQDITERKKAQEAIKKEQQFITTLFDTAEALIVVVDPQGRILRFNRACENLTGFSFEEVQGKHFEDTLLPASNKDEVNKYFQEYLHGQGSSIHENYWITKDKQLRWITWSNAVVRDEQGNPEFWIATGIDLTEQRRMQEALEKERKFVSQVLDTTGALVVILDPHSRILRMNRACKQMARCSPQELEGQPFMNLCVISGEDDHVVRPLVGSCQADRLPPVFEAALLNQSGQENWIQWETTTINEGNGEVKYVIATGTDITERRQTENILRETSQRLEAQQKQLRTLAAQLLDAQEAERRRIARDLHDDVNQRLALLNLQVQSALQIIPEYDPFRETFQTLDQDLAKISDDLRHLAYQYHPSILDDLGLEVALRSLIDEISHAKSLSIELLSKNMPDSLSQNVGTCLYRITQESLQNILKYAKALKVSVELIGEPRGVTLSIRDDGKGFDPEKMISHGLGLVSMRERVHQVGGTFHLESRPGYGTIVKVWVPNGEQSSL